MDQGVLQRGLMGHLILQASCCPRRVVDGRVSSRISVQRTESSLSCHNQSVSLSRYRSQYALSSRSWGILDWLTAILIFSTGTFGPVLDDVAKSSDLKSWT